MDGGRGDVEVGGDADGGEAVEEVVGADEVGLDLEWGIVGGGVGEFEEEEGRGAGDFSRYLC